MDIIPADFYRSDIILSDGRRWLLRVSATEGGDQQQQQRQRQQECGRPHRSASRVKRCCALRARKFIRTSAAERGSSSHTQWLRDAGGEFKEAENGNGVKKSTSREDVQEKSEAQGKQLLGII